MLEAVVNDRRERRIRDQVIVGVENPQFRNCYDRALFILGVREILGCVHEEVRSEVSCNYGLSNNR